MHVDEHATRTVLLFPAAHWPAAFVRDEPSPEVEMARNPAVQRLVAKAICDYGVPAMVLKSVADGTLTLEIPND